jgi:hypothetical protein
MSNNNRNTQGIKNIISSSKGKLGDGDIVREHFRQLQRDTGFPISEVMDVNNDEGTRLTYSMIETSSLQNRLNRSDSVGSGVIDNIAGTMGETIVLQDIRKLNRVTGLAIYEPGRQRNAVLNLNEKIRSRQVPDGSSILKTFSKYTPDILSVSTTITIKAGNSKFTIYPTIKGIAVPGKPPGKANELYKFKGKTVIAPVEVTIAAGRNKWKQMKQKAEKLLEMSKSARNLANKPNVAYVPLLYIDTNSYTGLSLDNQKELVDILKQAGGYVVFSDNLREKSLLYAEASVALINSEVDSQKNKYRSMNSSNSRLSSRNISPAAATNQQMANVKSLSSQFQFYQPERLNSKEVSDAKLNEGKVSQPTKVQSLTSAEIIAERIQNSLREAGIFQDSGGSGEFELAFKGVVEKLKNISNDKKREILVAQGIEITTPKSPQKPLQI